MILPRRDRMAILISAQSFSRTFCSHNQKRFGCCKSHSCVHFEQVRLSIPSSCRTRYRVAGSGPSSSPPQASLRPLSCLPPPHTVSNSSMRKLGTLPFISNRINRPYSLYPFRDHNPLNAHLCALDPNPLMHHLGSYLRCADTQVDSNHRPTNRHSCSPYPAELVEGAKAVITDIQRLSKK
jgi:hypothetical protein